MAITPSPFSRRPQRGLDDIADDVTESFVDQMRRVGSTAAPTAVRGGADLGELVQPELGRRRYEDYYTPQDIQALVASGVEDVSATLGSGSPEIEELIAAGKGEDVQKVKSTLGKYLGVAAEGALKALAPIDWSRRAMLATMVELDKRGHQDYWDFGDSGLANFAEGAVGVAFDLPTKLSGFDLLPEISEQIREMRGIEPQVAEGRENVYDRGFMDLFNDESFGYGQILYDKSGGGFETSVGGRLGRAMDLVGGLAGDVAFDPLTYVTLGSNQYVGRSGRAGLAAITQEADVLARIPSLADNPQRIVRYGEWGLTKAEREALVDMGKIDKAGIRSVGREAKPIVGTGGVARVFGRGIAEARAIAGDLLVGSGRRAEFVTPPSFRPLIQAARRGADPTQARNAIIRTAISQYAKGDGSRMAAKLASQQIQLPDGRTQSVKELVEELADSPFDGEIARIIEPSGAGPKVAGAVDPRAEDLALRVRATFDQMRDTYNQALNDFAAKYNLDPRAVVDIGQIDDYVFHTITPEAKRLIRSVRDNRQGWMSAIRDAVDLSPAELTRGPLRSRVLKKGEEWLGEELQTGSIDEINEIFRRVTGKDFDWFETQASTILASYANSLGRAYRRVSMMDRLFDFGDDLIRPVIVETIPDPQAQAAATRALNRSNNRRNGIIDAINNILGGKNIKTPNSVRVLAEQIVMGKDVDAAEAAVALREARKELRDETRKLDRARVAAEKKGVKIAEAFDAIIAPIRARNEALAKALDENRGAREAARQALTEEHARLFPNVVDRPTSIKELAKEIVTESRRVGGRTERALTTRIERARRKAGPTGRAEGKRKRAAAEVEAVSEQIDLSEAELASAKELFDSANVSDEFPDGFMFVDADDYMAVRAGRTNNIPVTADPDEIPSANRLALPAPEVNYILNAAEKPEALFELWNNLHVVLRDVIEDITQDEYLAQEFVSEVDRVRRTGNDPLFTLPEEIQALVRVMVAGDEIAGVDPAMLADAADGLIADASQMLSDLAGTYGAGQIPADEMVIEALIDSAPRFIDQDTVVILPDTQYGSVPYLTGQSGIRPVSGVSEVDQPELFNLATEGSTGVRTQIEALKAELDAMRGARGEAMAAQEAAEQTQAEAREVAAQAGRELGGVRGAQTRLEKRVEARRKAAQGPRELQVQGKPITPKDAAAERKATAAEIKRQEKALREKMANDPTLAKVADKEEAVATATAVFDAATAVSADEALWQTQVRPLYEQAIDDVRQVMDDLPRDIKGSGVVSGWLDRANKTLADIETTAALTDKEKAIWAKVNQQLFGLEADLAKAETQIVIDQNVLRQIENGNMNQKIVKDILDGWVEMERLGVQIPREFRDELFERVQQFTNPSEFSSWKNAFQEYNRFFKAWAIATPGFHVRNALTAAWNNWVAGVSNKDMRNAIKFSKDYMTRGYDYAIAQVPEAERQLYADAFAAVGGAGGGQAVDELMPLVKGRGSRGWRRSYNNAVTRTSQRAGEGIEVAARMAMGVDGARRGFNLETNTARIRRYHFDYSDLSGLDQFAKQFIPFWTFASRNVQLQYVNMLTRPSLYQRYEALRRNDATVDKTYYPLWRRRREGIDIGQNRGILLDLPQVDLMEQIARLSEPLQLLAQASPLIRVPIEQATDESLAFGTPFSDKPQKIGLGDIPSVALGGLSDMFFPTDYVDLKNMEISAAGADLAPSLIPLLQQIQRVATPVAREAGAEGVVRQLGGPERYEYRDLLTTLGSYLGVPYYRNTGEEIQGEIRRQMFTINDLVEAAREMARDEQRRRRQGG